MSNITTEVLYIKGVNPRPKFPRFNSGSILVTLEDGTDVWYNVDKNLEIQKFKKETEVNVEVETNAKGYKCVVALLSEVKPEKETKNIETLPGDAKGFIKNLPTTKGRDYDAEARGKVACASYTAAIQSQAVAIQSKGIEDFLKNVEVVAEFVIKKTFEHQQGK